MLVIAAPAGAFVYWSDLGEASIGRANLDGSAANPRFVGAADASGVAVDDSHIYWSNDTGGPYRLGRANLDGSGAQISFIDSYNRSGIAVNAEHIYWSAAGAIGRARLDGSDVQPQLITGTAAACGVAVDSAHVYWADADLNSNRIGRANLDGTGVNHNFITGAISPCGVAVNATNIYWANNQGASIGRANVDGSGVDQSFITGAIGACGVAVNATHIYWSRDHLAIGRANLNGTAVNQNFRSASVGCGVAVDALTTATMTVTPSPAQIVYGQEITFDASVTGPGSGPTGNVQFFVNGEPDGAPAPLDVAGRASYSPTFLLGVGDLVSATYSGDAAYGAVRASTAPGIVQPAPTSTQVVVEPGTVVTAGSVEFTATVTNTLTDITPIGSVQIVIDGELIGPPLELDENGQAILGVIASVPPADYLVTARYVDDIPPIPYFVPSEGSQVVHVTAAPASGGTTPPIPRSTPVPAPPTPTVVRKETLTAVGATLIKALKQRGFPALTGPLSYVAPGPGTLTQSIYAQGGHSSASAARAKETLIASGRRVFAAAGNGALRPKLTTAGRRIVKRAKRLKLRIVTRFAPTTGNAASASQRATIKRRGRRAKAVAIASEWTVTSRRHRVAR